MPAPVITVKLSQSSTTNPSSLYNIDITGAGTTQLPLSTFAGWALGTGNSIADAQTYTANVYSSYNFGSLINNMPSWFVDSIGPTSVTNRLEHINWIINQDYLNQVAADNQYYSSGDIQLALWTIWGSSISNADYLAVGVYSQARVDQIVAAAGNQGQYFPSAGQSIGMVLEPVDGNGVHLQPIFVPVKAAAVNGTIWDDSNANGILDYSTEYPIYGAKVVVGQDLNNDGDINDADEFIGEAGQFGAGYALTPLLPGLAYQLQFQKPDGTAFSPRSAGNGLNDSSADAAGNSAKFFLTAGQVKNWMSAGIAMPYLPSQAGGRVWMDANDNGIQDTGEIGVAGVLATLTDISSNFPANDISVLSDADGKFLFTDLRPGIYRIDFDRNTLPAGYHFSSAFQGSDPSLDSNVYPTAFISDAIDLTGGGKAQLSVDAGISNSKGSIGNKVWLDTLSSVDPVDPWSGLRIPSSGTGGLTAPGVAGVTATLYQAGADQAFGTNDDVILASQVTDSLGHYEFTNLENGDYQVGFSNLSTDFEFTRAFAYFFDALSEHDSNVEPSTGRSDTITLIDGEKRTDVDAGIRDRFGSISGLQWLDSDGDGFQNETSGPGGTLPILAGVPVTLYQAGPDQEFGNADDVAIATTHTDVNGKYVFDHLDAGFYQVGFSKPSTNFVYTAEITAYSPGHAGTDSTAIDSDVMPLSARSHEFELQEAEDLRHLDAGVSEKATLSSTVWLDSNQNGLQDTGEPGLPGVSVNLLYSAFSGGGLYPSNIAATTTTDANGDYSFDTKPGTAFVQIKLPMGYAFSANDQGSDDHLDSDFIDYLQVAEFTVASGAIKTDLDAGLYAIPMTANIGDKIWQDVNFDGIQDFREPGIGNVTVALLNAQGAVVSSTVTDNYGNYQFTGVTPGKYQLHVSAPAGHVYTALHNTANANIDSDVGSTGKTALLYFGAGNQLSIDAGLYRKDSTGAPAQIGSVGDTVWEDLNADGLHDLNEIGMAGVTVQLLADDGAVVGSTVTNSVGYYQFKDIAVGNYQIHVAAPSGYVFSQANQIDYSNNGLGNSMVDNNGLSPLFNLSVGEHEQHQDAGLFKAELSTSVGDRIWEDENHNGQQDLGEWNKGIAGVTVELLDANNQVLKTTTSDAGGNYLFSGLGTGTYKIHVLAPTGYLFTPNNHYDETSDSDTDSSGISAPFNLAIADKNLDIDAGLYRTASIGDKVWLDSNQNGLQDSNEQGLASVTVNLLNASNANALMRSVVTDSNGDYLFTNVDVGNYSIAVVAPTGYAFSDAFVQNASQPDSYNNNDSNVDKNGQTAALNIWVSGYQNLSIDAGLYPTTATASVGNRVWEDANSNGIQDEGEWNKGMAGISVQLLNAADQVINTTQTDGGGHYSFNNLEPGNYKIHVLAPSAAYQFTQANQNGAGAGNSVTDSNGTSPLFTLTAGENNLSMDAGLYSKALLGDRVWLDDNQNGIQDGNEQGLAGVTVNLLNALDANKLIKSVLTDTNGHYQFNDLDLGNYTVQVQAPAGYAFTTPAVGTDQNLDSSVDSNGQTAAIPIWVSGFSDLSLDAGLVVNTAIQASSVVAESTQLITGADAGLAANSVIVPEQAVYAELSGLANPNGFVELAAIDSSVQLLHLTGQAEFTSF